MCFGLRKVCGGEETELGRQQAPGVCPYCGGKVLAMDVQINWILLCCLPACFSIKRKYLCSLCDRHLALFPPTG